MVVHFSAHYVPEVRHKIVELTTRFLAGDAALIAEIDANFVSEEPVHVMAREAKARLDAGAAHEAAVLGAGWTSAEGLQDVGDGDDDHVMNEQQHGEGRSGEPVVEDLQLSLRRCLPALVRAAEIIPQFVEDSRIAREQFNATVTLLIDENKLARKDAKDAAEAARKDAKDAAEAARKDAKDAAEAARKDAKDAAEAAREDAKQQAKDFTTIVTAVVDQNKSLAAKIKEFMERQMESAGARAGDININLHQNNNAGPGAPLPVSISKENIELLKQFLPEFWAFDEERTPAPVRFQPLLERVNAFANQHDLAAIKTKGQLGKALKYLGFGLRHRDSGVRIAGKPRRISVTDKAAAKRTLG